MAGRGFFELAAKGARMDFVALRGHMRELDDEDWDAVREAAEGGDPEAQFLLGCRFWDGVLVSDDCEEWLKRAAAQDHPEAVYWLAQTTFRPSIVTRTIPVTEEQVSLVSSRGVGLG